MIATVTFMRHAAQSPSLDSIATPAMDWREIPDLANNVDFYHWMEDRIHVPADHKGT